MIESLGGVSGDGRSGCRPRSWNYSWKNGEPFLGQQERLGQLLGILDWLRDSYGHRYAEITARLLPYTTKSAAEYEQIHLDPLALEALADARRYLGTCSLS